MNETATLPFTTKDTPMLISAKEGMGASKLALDLMAQFVRSGEKILFFTAFPPAKADLRKQLGDLANNTERVIIMDSGEVKALSETIDKLSDLEERIVLIKNIEQYDSQLLELIKRLSHVIVAGDVDQCAFAQELRELPFATTIAFPEKYKWVVC